MKFLDGIHKYTGFTYYTTILDSASNNLNKCTLNHTLQNHKNVLTIFETKNGNFFGAFHSTIQKLNDYELQVDEKSFVFSFVNGNFYCSRNYDNGSYFNSPKNLYQVAQAFKVEDNLNTTYSAYSNRFYNNTICFPEENPIKFVAVCLSK
ncbi:hypothetical protein EIN_025130 [Entamoeba invadens IP1]|uniref:hypothetical protein n=1 Tax=Entamoeba invadens IP1 TaxID=370355 RepID=UPI0002C3ECEF|nr:hypothetical protein EIN_025130 [Entamoeba invadens IP1]ELP90714.1 hypothetical protein EIN_025130 [Entamoeba invadens IP1]|eukprot:XP_004257485.1 hypothetical protein EIN_025130 [Entamoeba invadens IP1]